MLLVQNRRARSEYQIEKTFTAGIVLTGPEVKSLRAKKASLTGSFVKVIGGEVFLLNAQINPYEYADNRDYDPKRTRKLLFKKSEIEQLVTYTNQKNYTLVPLSIQLQNNRIKVEVGLGRGLKKYEKRERLKRRDIERDTARELKWR